MSRNKNRLEGHLPEHTEAPPALSPLNFVTPTEFVELPSGGQGYPETHPLHEQETIEIKFMTAKDEDILTSQALLKKGIALDRFLENIVVNKNIDTSSLLIGDKNAVLVAARGSGYGFDYDSEIDSNEPIEAELSYVFVSERGFRKSNSSSFKGKDIMSIKKRKLEDVPLKYLKEITTKAIGICLEGKDLTSRKIFKSIKK